MTRRIILPVGFEVWEHGKLVAVAVRNIYAGEPWGAEMFVNYAGISLADFPDAIIGLRTFVTVAKMEN